jgi:hypothetical protein
MANQIKVRVGNLVMMKSSRMALVTKVADQEKYLGGTLSYIEVQYSNGFRDSCSAWRVKELISG